MRVPLLALIFSALTAAAAAQPQPLFEVRNDRASAASAGSTLDHGVVSRAYVGMHLDLLFDVAQSASQRVTLNVGDHTWTASLERLDHDGSGFRSWVGSVDGIPESHVVFSERDGVVSGLINAVGTTYQLRTAAPGTYLLEGVDLETFAAERDPVHLPSEVLSRDGSRNQASADDGRTIDVLILYTPAARSRLGHTAQVEALVSQVISDTNTAFARSGIVPRVRLAGSFELPFIEASQMTADLPALRNSPDARLLRDVYRADLVQLLVSSPDQESCGIGYLLSPETADFDAYSIADVSCAAQYTPTHELAHNLGSHHAPDDGASGALFPYSYAYKDPERGFRTVMAYPCVGVSCPRILNFSNPAVRYDGSATGTPTQHNARSISEAAPFVARFRDSAPLTGAVPPAAPTSLRATVNGTAVTVAWQSPLTSPTTGVATSYVLQVGTRPGISDIFNASTGNVMTVSGTVPTGVYYWRVVAVNDAGASPPSAESQFAVGACAPPSSPGPLAATVEGRRVRLTWGSASGAGDVTYVVDAGSSAGAADILSADVGAGRTLTTDAPPGTYYVRVRARNACGSSGPSNEQLVVVR